MEGLLFLDGLIPWRLRHERNFLEGDMKAPELLKAEMPLVHRVEENLKSYGYDKADQDYIRAFDIELAYYRKFGWTIEDRQSNEDKP